MEPAGNEEEGGVGVGSGELGPQGADGGVGPEVCATREGRMVPVSLGDVSQDEAAGEAESTGGFLYSVWESREWVCGLAGGRCVEGEIEDERKKQVKGKVLVGGGVSVGGVAGEGLRCAPRV